MNVDEDKKRKESSNNDDRPNKRLLSSSEASVQIPLEVKDQNLLQFQNRAMKIRVEELKIELGDRDYKIKDLGLKLHTYDETVSYLCRTWDQLNDGLNLLLLKVFNNSNSNIGPNLEELLPQLNLTESYQFLTNYITEPQAIEEGYHIDNILQQRVQKTQQIFQRVSVALEKEHSLSTIIFRLLKSLPQVPHTDIERLLKEDNDKLSKQNQTFQLVYDRLHIQYKNLSDQSSRFLDQIGSYQSEIKELKIELERLTDELNIEKKRVFKLSDESLRLHTKIPSPLLNNNQLNSNQQSNNNNINQSNNNNINQNNITPLNTPLGTPKSLPELMMISNQNNQMNQQNNQESTDLIAELTKLSEGRLNEARKLREEKANLQKELQQIHIELKIIPEEKILSSLQYQALRQRTQFMTEELDIHRQQCQKLQNDLNQATISRRIDREQIEAFEATRRINLERRIQQLEAEAIELKQEKEKLITMIEPRNQNIPSQEYIHESKILLDAKDKDIAKLNKEIERLKQENSQLSNHKLEIQKIQDQSKELIEKKNLELKELKEKLLILERLNENFKSLELNYIEKEKEMQLTIETLKQSVEGNVIDTVELKISETKLKEELEHIRKQFKEIELLKESHAKETLSIRDAFENKVKELESKINVNLSNQESQKQELEALILEIDSMGKEYEQMQEQNTRLIKQLSEREDTYAQLMAENIKSQQSIRLSKESQQAMEEKMIRSEEKMKSQNDIMLKVDEKAKVLQNQLSKLTEDLHLCNFELEKNKRLVREFNAQSIELRTQLDHMGVLSIELKKKADDSIFALEREIDKAKRLDEEKQSLKKKLEKVQSGPISSSNISPDDEVRIINNRLRCTICNDRQKNTVIAKCFHVFCKECIYSNIDTRKRRCPGCNRIFAETDVHQIYL